MDYLSHQTSGSVNIYETNLCRGKEVRIEIFISFMVNNFFDFQKPEKALQDKQ